MQRVCVSRFLGLSATALELCGCGFTRPNQKEFIALLGESWPESQSGLLRNISAWERQIESKGENRTMLMLHKHYANCSVEMRFNLMVGTAGHWASAGKLRISSRISRVKYSEPLHQNLVFITIYVELYFKVRTIFRTSECHGAASARKMEK
jgi:hypothetical protein